MHTSVQRDRPNAHRPLLRPSKLRAHALKKLAMLPLISTVWTMSSKSTAFDAWWGWPPPVLDPAGPYADSVLVLAWALVGMGVVVTATFLFYLEDDAGCDIGGTRATPLMASG